MTKIIPAIIPPAIKVFLRVEELVSESLLLLFSEFGREFVGSLSLSSFFISWKLLKSNSLLS